MKVRRRGTCETYRQKGFPVPTYHDARFLLMTLRRSRIGCFLFPSLGTSFPRNQRASIPYLHALITLGKFRAHRTHGQLGPSPQTPPPLVHRPAAIKDLKGTPEEKPVPAEVLPAGDRRVQGRPDVAHAPELQLVNADARNEAISYLFPSFPPKPFSNSPRDTVARPVDTGSKPPRAVHDAHPADPTRLQPRAVSLSSTHMGTCIT